MTRVNEKMASQVTLFTLSDLGDRGGNERSVLTTDNLVSVLSLQEHRRGG
jgi:hypothetical protein